MTAPRPEPRWQVMVERALFAARWLVVPFYAALLLALLMLFVVFARTLLAYLPKLLALDVDTVILATLALIDIALVANLVVIVVLASYEMMVSRIDTDAERPGWMGALGFGDVKLKLFSSIVAISGIQLLKLFMGLDGPNPPAETTLFWLVVVHVTFVVSTLLSALSEWISSQAKGRK
ncbi:YqhA family protein [Thermaurantiacus tibetensis]|uniref:YqhA family protein n=1 Tax=Thermaurantiacus tibetensis TaxID=2759035 RepID=UPI001A9CA993|nr:YqhA family protein [Thermaurantiacus tibetensis]